MRACARVSVCVRVRVCVSVCVHVRVCMIIHVKSNFAVAVPASPKLSSVM